MTPTAVPEVMESVLAVLQDHPEGLSEYELLRALQQQHPRTEWQCRFDNHLELFRAHFLLFHTLYRLREQLWENQRASLEISPLRIAMGPYGARETEALAHRDPLRDYYMDLSNLEATSAEEVEQMLGGVWARLQANERKAEALAVLELSEPVDFGTVKRRYRELAMRHHPDRGGDQQRLQEIHEAMDILSRLYR